MGCSTSRKPASPLITYTVSYCSLLPISKNRFQIMLIAKEELAIKKERKFFDQIGKNHDKDILDFCQNKNFEKKTLFYIFSRNDQPQIKNLYQMFNLIPNDIANLKQIFLLSTERAKNFPNFFILRKTYTLSLSEFIGYEIDLNDMVNILQGMNDINITNDGVNYEDDSLIENPLKK